MQVGVYDQQPHVSGVEVARLCLLVILTLLLVHCRSVCGLFDGHVNIMPEIPISHHIEVVLDGFPFQLQLQMA